VKAQAQNTVAGGCESATILQGEVRQCCLASQEEYTFNKKIRAMYLTVASAAAGMFDAG
jgi:hypothetical protein